MFRSKTHALYFYLYYFSDSSLTVLRLYNSIADDTCHLGRFIQSTAQENSVIHERVEAAVSDSFTVNS